MEAAPIVQPVTTHTALAAAATHCTETIAPEASSAELITASAVKTTPVQIVLIALGTIAFLYFARPVILPIFLACVAAMALKPLIRWLSYGHVPPALSAA